MFVQLLLVALDTMVLVLRTHASVLSIVGSVAGLLKSLALLEANSVRLLAILDAAISATQLQLLDEVVASKFVAFYSLIARPPGNKVPLMRALDVVLAAMSAHEARADVIASGFRFVQRLAREPANVSTLLLHIDFVTKLSALHADDDEVVEEGLLALCEVAEHTAAIHALRTSDAVSIAREAAARHSDIDSIVEASAELLGKLGR